jgi:hypothetical protein
MLQQVIAIIIILFFFYRLLQEKAKKEVNSQEFALWSSFWLLAALAIAGIKYIDEFVHLLGFSGSGINFLIYLAVLVLFYLVFRLQLTLAKLDRDLTEVARRLALTSKK